MERVMSGRRVCSRTAGMRMFGCRYSVAIPPSSVISLRNIDRELGVLGWDKGMAINRVRISSSGDRSRWVNR